MNKSDAIDQVYRIATLTEPTDEIRELLRPLDFDRVLELLLIMRTSQRPVKNAAGFLRRAILEEWKPGQLPEKIARKLENSEERYYMRRGYSKEQAQAQVLENRKRAAEYERY